MKLDYLRMTNKLTNYRYTINLKPLIRKRSKEYASDYGYGYCVEDYYLAKVGTLENLQSYQ